MGFKSYLDRSVSQDTIRNFCLGYCSSNSVKLAYQTGKGGFPAEWGTYLKENKFKYDNTLIFPVLDVSGKIVGMAFRPAYRKEFFFNDYFRKTRHLYGLHSAVQSIFDKKFAIVVEGLFDVLVAHSLGFSNVVGVFGNKISYTQACNLKRYTSNVLIIGDGDAGGRTLINRGSYMLKEVGVKSIKSLYVHGKDPDQLFLSGEYKFGEF